MSRFSMNRRSFLRGTLGVAVALPTLEIMLNSHGTAYASEGAIHKRFFVGFAGNAIGADGDDGPLHYAPDTIGANYDLKLATETLANHGNIKDRINIISGLRIPYNTGDGIPAGGWSHDFHTQALGPLISGMRNEDSGDYSVNGATADQIVAEAIGQDSLFRSLQYQVQASWYLTVSAPYGRDVLSYRNVGGDIQAMPGQISPKAAYDALFTSFIPPDDVDAAAKATELLKRQSVVDLVRGDFASLMPRLGAADKIRMTRHMDELRDLERQLDAAGQSQTESCFQFADPGADPTVGGLQDSSGGGDFDVNSGWSDETARGRVFADLVHMAFACDLTRSISMLYTMAQSHLSVYGMTGQPYDLHELGHSGLGTEVFSEISAWHLDQFGYLVAKLRDTPEGAGTLLDNCAMVLLHEGGHGYDPGGGDDNSSHSTENMVVCTAGGAGGMTQGEHIVAEGYHPVNVLNSAMLAVGVDANLGEVSGTIPGLI